MTIARNLSCWPLPACLISSLAANLPILPNPYKTTSCGLKLCFSAPIKLFNVVFKKSSTEENWFLAGSQL